MQGCNDILTQMFCHNSFSGVLSFDIQNAIIFSRLVIVIQEIIVHSY
jgi:hypothetical protein